MSEIPASLAPPAVGSPAFDRSLVPPEVAGRILSLVVEAAPFAASLTLQKISTASVVFPTARPSGLAWLAELDRFPLMTLGDGKHEVAVAKLGGLIDVSNEMLHDSQVNLTSELGRILGDSMSADLDHGLLFGEGPPEPAGILNVASDVEGPSFLEAAAAAAGEIGDAGGKANTLAAAPSLLTRENARTGDDGQLVYGQGGIAGTLALNAVGVPGLTSPLVYDSSRLFLVLNGDWSEVDMSTEFRYDYDATTFRVKSRVAAACPDPARTIRKLTIAA